MAVLLAEQEHIRVVERQKLLHLTAEQAKALKGLTGQKYAVQAGKLLKADTVLTGRLFLIKDKLTVSVQALDLATSRVVAADQLSCRPAYLLEAALQMALRLAKQMSLPLPKIDLKKIDKSPIASLHFAKALSRFYAGNMDAALMQLMRTIDLDPDYVEVHYWSALCYGRLGEDAHAIIELNKFLKRVPAGEYAEQARGMLAEAKERQKHSTVPRLGPKVPEKKSGTDKPTPGPTSKPKPKPKPTKQPTADEQAARQCRGWLSMARNYTKAGLPDKAKSYLKRIISEHPGTKWSRQAQALLDTIEKPKD